MKLPAFFGHKRSINLLPKDSFESSTLGIVLEWALVFGKWCVILTQLIVMGAFLWRFGLDRNLTDLRKSIAKDTAVIKSYAQVEQNYILAQKQLAQAKIALASQESILKTIINLEQTTPSQVWFDRITLSPDSLTLNAYASTLPAFGQFLRSVQRDLMFDGVRIGKIESSASNGAQIQFDVSLSFADNTATKKASKK